VTSSQIANFATRAFLAKTSGSGQTCKIRGTATPCLAGPGDATSLLETGGFHEELSRTIYVAADVEITLNEPVEIGGKQYTVETIGSTGPGDKKLTLRQSK
jgi:hypothetical protein